MTPRERRHFVRDHRTAIFGYGRANDHETRRANRRDTGTFAGTRRLTATAGVPAQCAGGNGEIVEPPRHAAWSDIKRLERSVMPEYAPGTPSWVELSSQDADAAAAFYSELMGWSTTEPGPAEETGGYRMFQQDGKNVAGLMGHIQEGQPTVWMTYVSVADADETATKVSDAGGRAIVEPMDVMDIGRMAVFMDPTGAVFGVWQPRAFNGADLVNEPNSLCWNEVLTRDAESDKSFYTSVFPWTASRPSFEGAPETYTVWELFGKPVGGMMQMRDEFPAEVPAHWNVCFAVADCDATVAKARELGATITAGPVDMPIGRFASMIDPQGATLSLMQAPPSS
jgi:predicted enzyme related to lactoylglutathione lyase